MYRRHLPHWQPAGRPLFVTWRLAGSLPKSAIEQLERERRWESRALQLATKETEREEIARQSLRHRFRIVERALDKASFGPKWLSDPQVAALVVQTLQQSSQDLKLFDLHAYVVMPNHVHVLMQPNAPLARIMQSVKGFSSRKANRILGREGETFWQDESFDRWIRDGSEFARTRKYIENNPVVAGLVRIPKDWPWSSGVVG